MIFSKKSFKNSWFYLFKLKGRRQSFPIGYLAGNTFMSFCHTWERRSKLFDTADVLSNNDRRFCTVLLEATVSPTTWDWVLVDLVDFFLLCFFCALQSIFLYFLCTVSGCDGGNRTRIIAVCIWRFSLLSYDRHPTELRPSPTELRPLPSELRPSPKLSYDRHPLSYDCRLVMIISFKLLF